MYFAGFYKVFRPIPLWLIIINEKNNFLMTASKSHFYSLAAQSDQKGIA